MGEAMDDPAPPEDSTESHRRASWPRGSQPVHQSIKLEEIMTADTDLDRRDFIGAAGIAATGLAAATILRPGPAAAQAAPAAGRPPISYEVKKLPFEPSRIKGLSEKLLVSHYENNYTGAVKRLNAIEVQLAQTDFATAPVFVINGLKREALIAANSMILHELFFDGIGGEGQPSDGLAEALTRDFGSIDRWKTEFAAIGKAEGGGSGWVMLTYSPRDKQLINTWAADHTNNLAGGRPILVLDMYEHAYQMDYGAKAAAYVDAFMQMIRWDTVAKLHERYANQA
jgi:Fe-Mn family superoxide dismutase